LGSQWKKSRTITIEERKNENGSSRSEGEKI
jgi:hypothetical protein